MKQLSILILLSLTISISLAQDVATNNLVKKWKLTEVEEFGSKYPPNDEQKNDVIVFSAENLYTGLITGKAIEGKWSDKNGKYILAPNKEKSVFKVNWIKVVSVDAEKLVLSYQSEDLITTLLTFSVAE